MANPTTSETGRGGRGTGHQTDCRTKLTQALVNFSQWTANLPIIAVGEEGQKIRFKLLFRLMNERVKKKGTKKKLHATIPQWWKE